MLTAEAEKRVREIAREAAEKAVLDNRVSVGKQTDLSGDVATLEETLTDLQRSNEQLNNRVTDLEYEVRNLQKEVDSLKSDVSSVLK